MHCLLPDTAIRVDEWLPHSCGGYYAHARWCYGPHGRIGYWMGDDEADEGWRVDGLR
jgi:hypothetical protein